MVMLEIEGAQGELEMVHAKTFVPIPNPLTGLVADKEFEITPVPETKVQTPLPTNGTFADIVAVGTLKQIVWLGPAFEIVGSGFTYMATVDVEEAHGGLLIVHAKMFVPNPNPVMLVVGERELVIVPLPDSKDHVPTPTLAELAAIIVFGLEMQIVWLEPAFAAVGI